jgi:hypothetical protein
MVLYRVPENRTAAGQHGHLKKLKVVYKWKAKD